MLLSGCANTRVIKYDSFCLWAKPITISKKEICTARKKQQIELLIAYAKKHDPNIQLNVDELCGLTKETLMEIAHYIDAYEEKCLKKAN